VVVVAVELGAPGTVGLVGAVVVVERGAVDVVVSWPRRYLPSSVPPHPGATSAKATAKAVAGIKVRSANSLPRPPRCGNGAAYR
jgi:hypothetical protein